VEVKDAKPARGGMTRSTRVSIFVNVVLICALATLLALAVIWLVGRLAWRHDLRLDLTRDARFTVDPMAASVLRGLSVPVHATFVYGIDQEIRVRALDLAGQPREQILDQYYRPVLLRAASQVQVILAEWSKLSELFTFDSIDADAEPQRMTDVAQRYGRNASDLARGINQVVFDMGSRRRSVPMGRMFTINWGRFDPRPGGLAVLPEMVGKPTVQSELTETLRALAAGETLKIGIPQGVSSAIPPEGPEWDALKELLVSQGFEPASFNLAQGIPEDVALVAVIGMGRKLLPDEIAELVRYEKQGGRLLVLADPNKPEDFARLLEPYGAKLEAALVEDPDRKDPRQPNPAVLLSNELCAGNHEIDRPVAGRIGIYAGLTRPLRIEDLRAPGAERIVLMHGSPAAKVVPIEFRAQTGEPDLVPAARKSAPGVPIAAVLRRPAEGRESRIVVFGGWEVASPRNLMLGTHYGNRDLVLNALNWIADRKGAIGVVEREIAASRVEVTQGFLSTFKWITMVALPFLMALGGVWAWMSRRS
jgi:hypothetical protein